MTETPTDIYADKNMNETKEYLIRVKGVEGENGENDSDVSFSDSDHSDRCDDDISTASAGSKEIQDVQEHNTLDHADDDFLLSSTPRKGTKAGPATGASSLMSLFPTQTSSIATTTQQSQHQNALNFPPNQFSLKTRDMDQDHSVIPTTSSSRDDDNNIQKHIFNKSDTRPKHHRQNTERISNSKKKTTFNDVATSNEMTHLFANPKRNNTYNNGSNIGSIPTTTSETYMNKFNTFGSKNNSNAFIYEPLSVRDKEQSSRSSVQSWSLKRCWKPCHFIQSTKQKLISVNLLSSLVGSLVFSLFHIVFCLAQASAIHRPYSKKPVLGVMVRMAAVGPLIGGTQFLYHLQDDFAAVCPTVDVFPAPFFAEMAAVVDGALVKAGLEEHDAIFLTTFGLLAGLSLALSGVLILIGTKVKLVNLGAFLPYPVMCGFFSSVGVLLWNLAFTVDTGKKIWDVASDGNIDVITHCMKHHIGSLLAGTIIFLSGKWNQKVVPLMAILPIPVVYLGLLVTGTTLKESQLNGWFWSGDEITVRVSWGNVDAIRWEAPMPFGVLNGIIQGKVHVPALVEGLPVALSMGLIYFIRCSLHAPALRKNSNNLLKWRDDQEQKKQNAASTRSIESETEAWAVGGGYKSDEEIDQDVMTPTNLPLSDVFNAYGRILSINGLAGGFAALPSIGVAGSMFKIGAAHSLPQYLSLFTLAIFYLTEFTCVEYLPKLTFSSLLFASSIGMIETWFIDSYKKTLVKSEWIVTPIIVVATFLVGSLQSVALGLAISTFLFVGTLNRSGVVKFISNGLAVHSITERNSDDAAWLDQNGDLIQLLVLQSYIFFGNANSCLSYVNSMFEEPPDEVLQNLTFPLPPVPKFLIIDMTMVVGMDTSSVDVFGEIVQLCFKKNCKVFMTGLQPSLKENLSLGGVKPSFDMKSANSALRFPPDIESALCKAEDALLKSHAQLEQQEIRRSRMRIDSSAGDGFLYALSEIDKQVR